MDRYAEFLLRLYGLARETPPDNFQARALDLLQSSFAFDSAFWGAGLLAGNDSLIPTSVVCCNIDPQSIVDWVDMNQVDKTIPTVLRQLGRAVPIHAPTLFSDPADSVMRNYTNRYGRNSYLTTGLSATPAGRARMVTDPLRWISLYRQDSDALFPDQDRRWIQSIVPHLMQSLDICRQLHDDATLSAPAEHPHDTSCAVAQADGRLLNAAPGFSALLAREWSQFDGQRLPDAVMASAGAGGQYRGRRIRLALHCAAGMLMIQAWPTTGQESTPDGLSLRQAEVARLYAAGYSYKEVASQLGISPTTVRNHLSAIFAITGAHSRRELETTLRS